ncbi:uncharacterized protein F4812DRAFT_268271 [Daldinia caldariorum]|uniref:uncharacterized protein n=1 Tax=Daldinia caldariorum TaxID=326644 RepID=UPI002008212F|nr:uncharacterized protein F4812DRAFT_268271 [Daldinia caldariorum]KAI1470507.1 hypothetical protein F4812DRAFT_268271 [Daldinia caldariorum]
MDRVNPSLGTVSSAQYIGVGIPSIVLSICFVAIRLSNTWRQEKKFLIEEYICILAIALSILVFALEIYVERTYEEETRKEISASETINISTSFFLIMEMAQTIIAAFLSFFAKIPLFMLYIRLFGSIKWVRMTCYFSIAVTLLQFTIGSSLLGVFCNPAGSKVLSPFGVYRCSTWIFYVVLWNGAIALVTDIILFALPFPIITKLQLQRRKKLNLAIVFMAGIVIAECCVAIMISCVPAIPPFWANHFSKMTFYLRIRSAISNLLARKSKTPMSSCENLQEHTSNEENNSHRLARLNDESATKKSRDMRFESSGSWLAV